MKEVDTMLMETTIESGAVRGVPSAGGFALYKGIPYAAPPVGPLRWRAPQPPLPWSGVRACDQWGPACPQSTPHTPDTPYGREFYASGDYPPPMGEDCLVLNVWTPAAAAGERLPVMVWIHGGAFTNGYGHEIEFDGDAICRRGCILVTIHYRLNVFGFFAHPDLARENDAGATGNYGLLDQIAALRWVRANIAAFGGDAGNVTVFGQSAGGRSTQALCCSPLPKGLFQRAIVQSSGGLSLPFGNNARATLEERGVRLMTALGCRTLSELRALSWRTLLKEFLRVDLGGGFTFCDDGLALPRPLTESLLAGEVHDVDLIAGCTVDEGCDGRTEHNLCASLRAWARVQRDAGRPMRLYVFDRKLPGDDWGAFHSAELWYVFGTIDRCWRPLTDDDRRLSAAMTDCWTNFARTGDPNGPGLARWEPFDDRGLAMRFAIDGCGMADYSLDGRMTALEDTLMANG